jgi:putative ATPase
MPLADQIRPASFDDMIGQQHLIGPHGILRRLAETKSARSVIFYGPPGCGKSTAALIYAKALNRPLYKLNAVDASVTDIKKIAANDDGTGSVVYLDEIQYPLAFPKHSR